MAEEKKKRRTRQHSTVPEHTAPRPTAEQYVETIAQLLTREKVCTISEIAEHAQVTRPAVSRAVRELAKQDLVVHKSYGYVDLTDKGMELAQRLERRHEALYRFLNQMLGLNEATAETEACRLEHQVSDELARRLEHLQRFVIDDAARKAAWRDMLRSLGEWEAPQDDDA